MFAILAAIIFGLALLFDLADVSMGDALNQSTLLMAGLFCVALHLAGVGSTWYGARRRRR
jgi:hypothetical protein